jgi:hypothetical protein
MVSGYIVGLGPTELIILVLCFGAPLLVGASVLVYWLMASGKDED